MRLIKFDAIGRSRPDACQEDFWTGTMLPEFFEDSHAGLGGLHAVLPYRHFGSSG